VCGSVAHEVGFGFDDAPREPALRDFVHESLADEIFCEVDCIDGKITESKAANALGRPVGFDACRCPPSM
jgi:hypothetical protein